MRRSLLRQLAVWIVVPCLFLAGALPTLTLFRCRHDEQVRLAPCCDDEEESSVQEELAALTAHDLDVCCDVTTLEASKLSYVPSHNDSSVPPPVVATIAAPEFLAVRATSLVRAPDWRVPFSTGVPIHIRHAALLN